MPSSKRRGKSSTSALHSAAKAVLARRAQASQDPGSQDQAGVGQENLPPPQVLQNLPGVAQSGLPQQSSPGLPPPQAAALPQS